MRYSTLDIDAKGLDQDRPKLVVRDRRGNARAGVEQIDPVAGQPLHPKFGGVDIIKRWIRPAEPAPPMILDPDRAVVGIIPEIERSFGPIRAAPFLSFRTDNAAAADDWGKGVRLDHMVDTPRARAGIIAQHDPKHPSNALYGRLVIPTGIEPVFSP